MPVNWFTWLIWYRWVFLLAVIVDKPRVMKTMNAYNPHGARAKAKLPEVFLRDLERILTRETNNIPSK